MRSATTTAAIDVEIPSRELSAFRGEWDYDATVEWLADHPEQLARFEGEWVAFAGTTIAAHAPSYEGAVIAARQCGVQMPLMVPVPPPSDLVAWSRSAEDVFSVDVPAVM